MRINTVNMSVGDYCRTFDRFEAEVDHTYQRSPNVWPELARSYLIETMLKEFPIPKLALHQVTDLKSRKSVKRVVDGQQRTMALLDFFHDKMRLSKTLELEVAADKLLSELPEELQNQFLAYNLTFDQFEAASEEVVREYFRRINSFTAPLNAEEQRHARFQGALKWFVVRRTEKYSDAFVQLGVLTKKSVVRMGDAKLIAELVPALLNGITTTNKNTLNAMYLKHDKGIRFEGDKEIRQAIDTAMNEILALEGIGSTALMKTHVFYSLVLAVIRVRLAWPALRYVSNTPRRAASLAENATENLTALAAALDDPDAHTEYEKFVEASAERTNVKAQRETRVRWLVAALTDNL
jgi:hypothetical protein